MGRPTIDGYWNSGKFCRARYQLRVHVCMEKVDGAYLCGVSNFKEAGSSVQDCGVRVSRDLIYCLAERKYLLEALP